MAPLSRRTEQSIDAYVEWLWGKLEIVNRDDAKRTVRRELVALIGNVAPRELGSRTSARKAKSSAENGRKGGRPRKTVKP